jgi:hypothetical protein
MAAIWSDNGKGWELLSPAGFPDEDTLHTLVEEAPHLLPLAGAPDLVVVGREVQLGTGYADLIAVERDGRIAVIEVKLAKNAEARRAVVSQVLAYAAYIHGTDIETLESEVLRTHLKKRGFAKLADAVAANDQQGRFDPKAFAVNLGQNLRDGRFRLVVVLDSAPDELVRLAGYLRVVAEKLVIDLVTVAAYEIAGSKVIVPQRVDSEHAEEKTASGKAAATTGVWSDGADAFDASIDRAKLEERPALRRLVEWARALEKEGLVDLSTYVGKLERWTLLPRLRADNAGLVTIWNDGGPSVQYWRSMFQKRAPTFIASIEARLKTKVGQGNTVRTVDDELLQLLTEAYRTAAKAGAKA